MSETGMEKASSQEHPKDRTLQRLECLYLDLAHSRLQEVRERKLAGDHITEATSWSLAAGKSQRAIDAILKQENGDGS